MKIAWTYIVVGSLALASAVMIIGGESAKAELRLVETATAAAATSWAH